MNVDDQRVTDILERLVAKEVAEEMQSSMDFDMLCEVMIPFGYVVVKIEYSNTKQWIDVMAWVVSNCIGDYQEHKGKWLFKNEQDAIMFRLKF